MTRERLDCESIISIGYLSIPYLELLDTEQIMKLLKILGNNKIDNYSLDLIKYLAKNVQKIIKNAESEPIGIQLELYKNWPSIFLSCKKIKNRYFYVKAY